MIGIIAINDGVNPVTLRINTNNVTNITSTTATSGGTISSYGENDVLQKGVCWGTNQNPTIDDNKTENGIGDSNFTSNITNLLSGTTYYIRAYLISYSDTLYGNEVSFTTAYNIPTITTTAISNIGIETAISGGTISGSGLGPINKRGICYSIFSSPTITGVFDHSTNNGNSSGVYSSNMSNLLHNTLYYVRAYVVTPLGTFYGNQITFTTDSLSVGDYYNGGTVAAVFDTPQNGYKGIIMKGRWLNNSGGNSPFLIYYRPYDYPFTPFRDGFCSTETKAGYGKTGTQAMLKAYDYETMASDGIAKIIWELGVNGEYWHLPTVFDLKEIFKNKTILGLDTFPSGSNYNWYATCSGVETVIFEPSKFYEYNIQGRPGYQNPWEAHNRDNKIIYSTLSIKYF